MYTFLAVLSVSLISFRVSSFSVIPTGIRACTRPRYSIATFATDDSVVNDGSSVSPEEPKVISETPEETYRREKLAEIAERKAQEVFMTRNTGKYECQACGYIYSEAQGLEKKGIAPGTPFDEIEKFRCPQVLNLVLDIF